jgi:hypothetical protein
VEFQNTRTALNSVEIHEICKKKSGHCEEWVKSAESAVSAGSAESTESALVHTVKGVQGIVSFDSQNDKYTSQLSFDASPEAYLSLRVTVKCICHLVNKM